MKKTILILMLLLTTAVTFSQTRFGRGIKLYNASEITDFSGSYEHIPVMKTNGFINRYIHSDSLVLQSQIKTLPYVPYVGATQNVDLGDNYIDTGKEVTNINKNIHYVLLSTNGTPMFRVMKSLWNGTSYLSDGPPRSIAIGQEASLNNTGASTTAYGYYSLKNNTGAFGAGFGISALENNTGANGSGFGQNSLKNNTGSNSSGFGAGTLFQNTGDFVTALGVSAGSFNTADNSTFAGHFSGRNNTGDASTMYGNRSGENNTGNYNSGFGQYSQQNATAIQSNGFGQFSLRNNKGNYSNGFGINTLLNNEGVSSNGFGDNVMVNNKGAYVIGFGQNSAHSNIGNSNIAIGNQSLKQSDGDNNIVVGNSSHSLFVADLSNKKTIQGSDISTSNNRVTINNHGFTTSYVRFITDPSPNNVSGVSQNGTGLNVNDRGTVFKVIDANTLECECNIISVTPTETYYLTPQKVIENNIIVGNNVQPEKSNQVILGNNLVDEVYSDGVFKSNIPVSEITEPKHLITKEYADANYSGGGGGGSGINSVVGGTSITIDNADPSNPVINTDAMTFQQLRDSLSIYEAGGNQLNIFRRQGNVLVAAWDPGYLLRLIGNGGVWIGAVSGGNKIVHTVTEADGMTIDFGGTGSSAGQIDEGFKFEKNQIGTGFSINTFDSSGSKYHLISKNAVANGVVEINKNSTGDVVIGGLTKLRAILQNSSAPPTSATDSGTQGEIRYDSNYLYICIGTGTIKWKRIPLTNW